MLTKELANATGETDNAIVRMIAKGKLAAEKVTDGGPVGYHWNITTPLDEAKAIMANRLRRKSPERRVKTPPAPPELPAKRDLFKPKEAARMAGINESSMYKWLKDNKIETLRNGRSAYIPRAVVEKMRAEFVKPVQSVIAPQVMSQKVDVERIEARIKDLTDFVKRFAKRCGFEG